MNVQRFEAIKRREMKQKLHERDMEKNKNDRDVQRKLHKHKK
jgi:hypothetical protein